ncbi:hypothetical protein [Arthrobacter dokdonensis]|uniref:hypothetical protein n=1 Tax=Arthrobacter dokdonellae TaxID=2211210 RepID=UPI003AAE80B9
MVTDPDAKSLDRIDTETRSLAEKAGGPTADCHLNRGAMELPDTRSRRGPPVLGWRREAAAVFH